MSSQYRSYHRRSKSKSSRKRLYGSSYQPGYTSRYQRYGRTYKLDPAYASIPRTLPTRQSQMVQYKELEKAGLVPSPRVVHYDVNDVLTLDQDVYAARGSTFTAICPAIGGNFEYNLLNEYEESHQQRPPSNPDNPAPTPELPDGTGTIVDPHESGNPYRVYNGKVLLYYAIHEFIGAYVSYCSFNYYVQFKVYDSITGITQWETGTAEITGEITKTYDLEHPDIISFGYILMPVGGASDDKYREPRIKLLKYNSSTGQYLDPQYWRYQGLSMDEIGASTKFYRGWRIVYKPYNVSILAYAYSLSYYKAYIQEN